MSQFTSVRGRLTSYYLLSVALLIGISVYALVQMAALDQLTKSLDRRWVVGTRVLGEMADLLSETRLAETFLALATDQEQTDRALAAADGYMRSIGYQRAAYGMLDKTDEELSLLKTFDQEWGTWAAEHRAWIALGHDRRLAASPAFQLRAHAYYRIADDAVDALSDVNAAGAAAAGTRADNIVNTSAVYFAIVVACALLLASWVTWVIHAGISRPLASITKALSDLAAGNRDIILPQVNRQDEIGSLAAAFEVFRTSAVALDFAEQEARKLAWHDTLTGLPNVRNFQERLDECLRATSAADQAAVLLLDLDGFQTVNDTYGHSIGDKTLGEFARRVSKVMRTDTHFARIGGDEFAIIKPKIASIEDPANLARRIAAAIDEPFSIDNASIEISVGIGIAIAPVDGVRSDELLRHANRALNRAKAAGRSSVKFFEPEMDVHFERRILLERELKAAIAADALRPYYQPLVSLADDRIVGFEALARWESGPLGHVQPAEFISIAEDTGLIVALGNQLFRRACLDAKAWPETLTLAFNVSPVQLHDPTLGLRILSTLLETGFSPWRLEIEITESALIESNGVAQAVVDELRQAGVRIALDDFGTGYATLSQLLSFNLDKIKIDRSFVSRIGQGNDGQVIADAVLGIAKGFGLTTTAEGVENATQLAYLKAKGCSQGQGYLFGKAVPAADIAKLLSQDKFTSAAVRGGVPRRGLRIQTSAL